MALVCSVIFAVKAVVFNHYIKKNEAISLVVDYQLLTTLLYACLGYLFYYENYGVKMEEFVYGFFGGIFDTIGCVLVGIAFNNAEKGGII